MREKTILGRIEETMPDWALPAFLIVAGILVYHFNDAIRSFATQSTTAPNYQSVGILMTIAGIFIFLRRRRFF
jgi:hypothetical protein